MVELDRDYLLEQLEKLGSQDDTTVLEAARAAHRHVEAAGFTWDDVLEPDEDDFDEDDLDEDELDGDEVDRDDLDGDDELGPDDDEDELEDGAGKGDDESGGQGDEGRLISELLANDAVTEDTREDLVDMQADFQNGQLSAMDRRFIRALAKRLDIR
ncbi:hypothetical protein [Fodinicurvata sp. EGI_FJ10296]|uniref:hypothetical protein n=1 Tax=Fodinicurvata sp. EGI_FJ10296 TaxID=3231908 RepID=UPI0034533CC2